MVFGNDHPAVHDALHRCREAGVPAITLATDLPGADRLCHVGINQLQAGRTAGLMLGRISIMKRASWRKRIWPKTSALTANRWLTHDKLNSCIRSMP
ncbi:hypothetical protein, partial [Acinetobacter baumannii]|uniref:hypothetical protein n=1 Tax=Acinetobacter baumannii TaxID=470 RepID=UPI00398C7DC7